MIWMVLIAELLLLIAIQKRIKVINPVTLSGIFIIASQAFYLSVQDTPSPSWMTGNVYFLSNGGVYLYGLVFFALYVSSLGITIEATSRGIDRVASLVTVIKIRPILLMITYAILLLFLAVVKVDLIWFSGSRDILDDPTSYYIAIGPALRKIISLYVLVVAFFFSVSVALAHERKSAARVAEAAVWLAPLTMMTLLLLGQASRSAVLAVMTTAATLIFFSRIKRVYILSVCGSLTYVFWIAALVGRESEFYGISMVPTFLIAATHIQMGTGDIFSNIFEGIFVTSEALTRPAEFTFAYKILSFSPFPSVIDNFSSYLEHDEIRLAWWIPMSALAEAYHFGIQYLVFYIAAYCAVFRQLLKSQKHLGSLYVLCTMLAVIALITSGAYPVRSNFRTLLIVAVFIQGARFAAPKAKFVLAAP